ncbi:uncharacterized protein LOC134253477 [Saccostrea cucullata]|uniref:uncharacterized protein LOC134253477 n=1 Tax=Saccostrea cuccullata TaxID=36930 RepID=UPI002ECFBD74
MDPVHDRHYIEELRKQAEEDAETRKMVQGLKRKLIKSETDRIKKHRKMLKIVDEIKSPKSVIPPNVRDIFEKEFKRWKEEDRVYSESHGFLAMLDKVREQPYMTFVGVPGSGKRFITCNDSSHSPDTPRRRMRGCTYYRHQED